MRQLCKNCNTLRNKLNKDGICRSCEIDLEIKSKVKKCVICGKEYHGLRDTCGNSHCNAKLAHQRRVQNGNFNSPFNNPEVREKSKETMKERYGVENIFANEQTKEKIKQTNLNRYGVEYVSQNKDIRKKMEDTCIKNYGTKSPFQSDIINVCFNMGRRK